MHAPISVTHTPHTDVHTQVVDYGCSHGANSIVPVLELAAALDARLESEAQRPDSQPLQVLVLHNDLPGNDWASLHALLGDPAKSYTSRPFQRVTLFPAALPRSFYEQVAPSASVHIGFSFSAMHWLRAPPRGLSGETPYLFSARATPEERAAASAQAGALAVAGSSSAAACMRACCAHSQHAACMQCAISRPHAWCMLVCRQGSDRLPERASKGVCGRRRAAVLHGR